MTPLFRHDWLEELPDEWPVSHQHSVDLQQEALVECVSVPWLQLSNSDGEITADIKRCLHKCET